MTKIGCTTIQICECDAETIKAIRDKNGMESIEKTISMIVDFYQERQKSPLPPINRKKLLDYLHARKTSVMPGSRGKIMEERCKIERNTLEDISGAVISGMTQTKAIITGDSTTIGRFLVDLKRQEKIYGIAIEISECEE